MSYARFGWDGSDVYVYKHVGGFLDCCGCILQEREWVNDAEAFFGGYLKSVGDEIQTEFYSTREMVEHLERHVAAGHCVPADAVPELRADDAENFPVPVEGGATSP